MARLPIYNGKSAILLQVDSAFIFTMVEELREGKGMNMATAQKLPTSVNGVAVDRLFSTIDAVKATPCIAKFKFRIRNQWETGSRNRSSVSTFTGANQELCRRMPFSRVAFVPARLLGRSLRANPVAVLPHALASCV